MHHQYTTTMMIVVHSHPGALLRQPHLTLLVSLHLVNMEVSLVNMVNMVNMEVSLDTWYWHWCVGEYFSILWMLKCRNDNLIG